jgi:hypothetical protein
MRLVIPKRNWHAFFRVPDNRCLGSPETLHVDEFTFGSNGERKMHGTWFEKRTEFESGGAYL